MVPPTQHRETFPVCRPARIPSNPDRIYKSNGWQGWVHWLGSNNWTADRFMAFDDALTFARSLGLNSAKEWSVYV